jgi:hypothetical protein
MTKANLHLFEETPMGLKVAITTSTVATVELFSSEELLMPATVVS